MNRKVRISHVIAYLILFYAVLGCLLPCHFKRDRMTAGNEAICGTVQVRLDQQVQQVFLAEGTYLRYLDLYVTSEDSAGETYRLFLYDEHNEQLLNRETAMPETALPGYLRIPIGVETEPGTAYVWQLKGTDTPMDLAFENTAGTGLTTFGNYYFLQDGKTQMQEGQNIVMRLVYTDRPAAWKVAAACGVLLLTAAALAAAVWAVGKRSSFLSRRIRVRWLAVAACGPVWDASALWLLYEIFVRNLFGGKAEDRIVYAAGIGIATLYFTWVLFGRRREKRLQPFLETVSEKGMDWLQSACFALVLMGTIHFMNAQFQVQQDLAYREVLFWGCLVLLTMGPAKAVLNRRGIGRAYLVSVPAVRGCRRSAAFADWLGDWHWDGGRPGSTFLCGQGARPPFCLAGAEPVLCLRAVWHIAAFGAVSQYQRLADLSGRIFRRFLSVLYRVGSPGSPALQFLQRRFPEFCVCAGVCAGPTALSGLGVFPL